ncbi:hypothetical protein MUK72_03930 [Halococcus dombrowskii]|uniref:Restriction endonuclease n=1 Tax=Halococcus dombrowskii TaxID=179637 RepID=A0AAX3AP50_HALDO|nr:hypothetical protein [Halococcus dombrowskii]UOO95864.1 hypothetical protein MUK72_03930 [Halococcus dombrowskii]
MYNETVAELEGYTDYVEFERLCSDILTGVGYRKIDPQGVEGRDGGKDALLNDRENNIVFHFSTNERWEGKLKDDLNKVVDKGIACNEFVFVSNRIINGERKSEVKDNVREEYDWRLEIYDAERLRAELDNHRQDLRKKYLGIPRNYQSHVDETINDLIDEHNEVRSHVVHSNYKRIVGFSIPNTQIDDRMKLFNQYYDFVGDRSYLDDTLSIGLPDISARLKTHVRSDHYSVGYKIENSQNNLTIAPAFPEKPQIHESNLYNTGVVEVVWDVSKITIGRNTIRKFIDNLFRTSNILYEDDVEGSEYITIGLALINSHQMEYSDGDEAFFGEEWLFVHREDEQLSAMKAHGFQNSFKKRSLNRIGNFFNHSTS